MAGVKRLVGPHDRHQIFRFTEIDDVVGIARQHMDGFDFFSGHLELHQLTGIQIPLPNQPVSGHHHEKFPLAVVPVLSLGNAGL